VPSKVPGLSCPLPGTFLSRGRRRCTVPHTDTLSPNDFILRLLAFSRQAKTSTKASRGIPASQFLPVWALAGQASIQRCSVRRVIHLQVGRDNRRICQNGYKSYRRTVLFSNQEVALSYPAEPARAWPRSYGVVWRRGWLYLLRMSPGGL